MSLTDGESNVFAAAFDDAGADYLATLDSPTIAFVEESTLGRDLHCVDDIDPSVVEVDDVAALGQAVLRRLTTPRGSVIDAPNYGRDLRELLSRGITEAGLDNALSAYREEVLKDERIESVTIRATKTDVASLEVRILCVSALGPFALTVDVTIAAVTLREASF